MKRAIIIGATSGIGREVALLLLKEGWHLGVAGRREEELKSLKATAPESVEYEVIDVTGSDAPLRLRHLINAIGGMDLYFHSSGVGSQNIQMLPDIELNTVKTNAEGFTRMITAAFNYFKETGCGHIAVISSIAGTKGLGAAPAYSATKRFQNTYIDALAQQSSMRKLNIRFTDIRPGFVDTALLKDTKYPLLMKPEKVARCIVKAINRKKRVVVIDWRYRILVALWRLIPRRLWERLNII